MTHLWTTGEALAVSTDTDGVPLRLTWRGQTYRVEHVVSHWRIDVEWWRQRIWRDYYKLTTTTGLLIVVYRDVQAENWYLQRLYD